MTLGQILIGNYPDLGNKHAEGIWSEFDAMVNSSNPTHLQLHALAMSEQANPADTLTGKLCALFNRLPLMRNVFTAMMLTKQPVMLQRFASSWTPPDVAVVCKFFPNTLGVEPGEYTVSANNDATVEVLRQLILHEVSPPLRPTAVLRLSFRGNALSQPGATLSELGITAGSSKVHCTGHYPDRGGILGRQRSDSTAHPQHRSPIRRPPGATAQLTQPSGGVGCPTPNRSDASSAPPAGDAPQAREQSSDGGAQPAVSVQGRLSKLQGLLMSTNDIAEFKTAVSTLVDSSVTEAWTTLTNSVQTATLLQDVQSYEAKHCVPEGTVEFLRGAMLQCAPGQTQEDKEAVVEAFESRTKAATRARGARLALDSKRAQMAALNAQEGAHLLPLPHAELQRMALEGANGLRSVLAARPDDNEDDEEHSRWWFTSERSLEMAVSMYMHARGHNHRSGPSHKPSDGNYHRVGAKFRAYKVSAGQVPRRRKSRKQTQPQQAVGPRLAEGLDIYISFVPAMNRWEVKRLVDVFGKRPDGVPAQGEVYDVATPTTGK